MGLRSYLLSNAGRKGEGVASTAPLQVAPTGLTERRHMIGRSCGDDFEMLAPSSTPNSLRESTPHCSVRSAHSSVFAKDIKHEVMVNYLFQQQCFNLWASEDSAGDIEGVILRKERGKYIACPSQLITSPLVLACATLDVQVGLHLSTCWIKYH
jgi:hypothetical protein